MVNRIRVPLVERLESRQLFASLASTPQVYGPVQPLGPLPPSDSVGQFAVPQFAVPLRGHHPGDVRAAEIRIRYDPAALKTDASRVSAGSFWNDRASLVVNVDEDAGEIHAFLFTIEPIESADADLIVIDFQFAESSVDDQNSLIEVQEVRINEIGVAIAQPGGQIGPLPLKNIDQAMRHWMPSRELALPADVCDAIAVKY